MPVRVEQLHYENAVAQARRCVAQAEWEAALAGFERALRHVPRSPVARAGRGHCLARLGRWREAETELVGAAKLLTRGGERGASLAGALLDIAQELQALFAFRASLAPIESALREGAGNARALRLQAHALLRLHDLEGARRAARRARELAADDSHACLLEAEAAARQGEPDAAERLLETVLADADTRWHAAALAELARLNDRRGAHARAFELATRAGALRRAARPGHDAGRLASDLAEQRRHCTREWLAAHGARGADGRADPVFLLGFYRSGTTLAEQVLAAHPALLTSGEAALLPVAQRELARLAPEDGRHWTARLAALGPGAADALRAHYWQAMEARFGALPRGTRLLDKTALNTVHLDWILTLFPRARIIFALRDARDVLISCHLQSFAPSALTAHCDEWQESARFYAEVLGHWEAMREVHALSCVTLRYEALVADLRGSMHDVLAFLGLEWQPGMQEFQRGARARTISTPSYAEVVEPLYARAVGRWRPYADEITRIVPTIAPLLARHGYA